MSSPLAGFVALLRAAGLPLGLDRVLLAEAAVAATGMGSRERLHAALRASLPTLAAELPLFDAAFALYWQAPNASLASLLPALPPLAQLRPRRAEAAALPRRLMEAITPPHAWKPAELPPLLARCGASGAEAGATREPEDGAAAAELAAARKQARQLAQQVPQPQRSRRWQTGRGGRIDLPAALRRLQAGRPLLPLPRQQRQPPPQRLLWLGDVSGSMQEASRALLLAAHAQAQRASRGLCWRFWAFCTRLHPLSALLRAEPDADRALQRLAELGINAAGGTRIGAALQQLLIEEGPRLAAGRCTLLLISDGLDHAPDDPLLVQMLAAWRRRGVRLLWLDPLQRDSLDASRLLAAGVDARLSYGAAPPAAVR